MAPALRIVRSALPASPVFERQKPKYQPPSAGFHRSVPARRFQGSRGVGRVRLRGARQRRPAMLRPGWLAPKRRRPAGSVRPIFAVVRSTVQRHRRAQHWWRSDCLGLRSRRCWRWGSRAAWRHWRPRQVAEPRAASRCASHTTRRRPSWPEPGRPMLRQGHAPRRVVLVANQPLDLKSVPAFDIFRFVRVPEVTLVGTFVRPRKARRRFRAKRHWPWPASHHLRLLRLSGPDRPA